MASNATRRRPAGCTACSTKRLAEVEFAGGDISIADFAILGWAWRHERHQVDLADFPNVKRWYETMMARSGVRRDFEVALS